MPGQCRRLISAGESAEQELRPPALIVESTAYATNDQKSRGTAEGAGRHIDKNHLILTIAAATFNVIIEDCRIRTIVWSWKTFWPSSIACWKTCSSSDLYHVHAQQISCSGSLIYVVLWIWRSFAQCLQDFMDILSQCMFQRGKTCTQCMFQGGKGVGSGMTDRGDGHCKCASQQIYIDTPNHYKVGAASLITMPRKVLRSAACMA